jgi:hypothetical protein
VTSIEIEAEQREVPELFGKQPVIPDGDLGEPVVGDHKGAGLRGGQVIEAEGRHLGNAEFAAGEQPAMAGDHVVVAIDQNRGIEVESLDAVGDLPDSACRNCRGSRSASSSAPIPDRRFVIGPCA